MGTNYTLKQTCCPTCKRGDEIHIGKSSAGWCFSLHVYPERNINTLEDWERLLHKPENMIQNEYGEAIDASTMMEIITERSWQYPRIEGDDLNRNHAVHGPNNLLRHKLDGVYCIGHGKGTWDYLIGDFS